MSKASEYAERLKIAQVLPAPFKIADPSNSNCSIDAANVSMSGELTCASLRISQKEALRFADWIYETFGDATELRKAFLGFEAKLADVNK